MGKWLCKLRFHKWDIELCWDHNGKHIHYGAACSRCFVIDTSR